jgi:diadenosine tetraphosphatase ApaH/serine/threonine PP2A family protein phosphatase
MPMCWVDRFFAQAYDKLLTADFLCHGGTITNQITTYLDHIRAKRRFPNYILSIVATRVNVDGVMSPPIHGRGRVKPQKIYGGHD